MTLGHTELNSLPFRQCSESAAADCTEMNKNVGAIILLNEGSPPARLPAENASLPAHLGVGEEDAPLLWNLDVLECVL